MAHGNNELSTDYYKELSADGLSAEDAALFEQAKSTFDPSKAKKDVPYQLNKKNATSYGSAIARKLLLKGAPLLKNKMSCSMRMFTASLQTKDRF